MRFCLTRKNEKWKEVFTTPQTNRKSPKERKKKIVSRKQHRTNIWHWIGEETKGRHSIIYMYMYIRIERKRLRNMYRFNFLSLYISKQPRFPLRCFALGLRPSFNAEDLFEPLFVPLPPFLFFRPLRSLRVRSLYLRISRTSV